MTLHESLKPPPAHVFYLRGFLPNWLLLAVTQIFFANVYRWVEGWSFYQSAYYCVMTATTVGYGDVIVATKTGKCVVILHIALCVVLLIEMLRALAELLTTRAEQLLRYERFQRRRDPAFVRKLLERAREFRRHDDESAGIRELEYAVAMLTELEVLSSEQLVPFLDEFRALDVRNDGRVGERDLVARHTAVWGRQPSSTVFNTSPRESNEVELGPAAGE